MKYNFDTINIKKYAKLKLKILCDANHITFTDMINELLDNPFAVKDAVIKVKKRKQNINAEIQ